MAQHDMDSADLREAALDAALQELALAEADVRGDMGDEALEAGWWDLVCGVAAQIPHKAVRFEFCRVTLGYIPQQVANLG